MTRIVVLCDGTWNSEDAQNPTNVARLADVLVNDPSQGQVVAYFRGVGTDRVFEGPVSGDGPLRRAFNKWAGGAFGYGLEGKVKEAYYFIAQAYSAGDEIYLFGFSRGAYTARSVAGMIRKCGIIRDTSLDGLGAAYRLYRMRGKRNHPDADWVRRRRREMSPDFATSEEDLAWRNDGSDLIRISYLGVWDTVGARGIPPVLLGPVATLWNRRYRFHDTKLSRLVRSARHALAVDERRVLYKPAKWENLDGPKGLNGGRDDDPLRPYQQQWFVGTHSIVGGSGPSPPLTAFSADWVLHGAGRLKLKPGAAFPSVAGDPVVDEETIVPRWRPLLRWRLGPDAPYEAHPSVKARWDGRRDYRPKSLARLFR